MWFTFSETVCNDMKVRNYPKSDLPVFNVNQLAKLEKLFHLKQWVIDSDNEFSTFERYVETLSKLSEEQQDFILKLSERFLHIRTDQYAKELIPTVERLRKDYPSSLLLFAQCLPESEIGHLKSSAAVLYQFKGNSIKTSIDLGKHTVCASDIKDYLGNLEKMQFKVVLVDDYIGTGETALGAIEYVKKVCPYPIDNGDILVLCIVAMKAGVEKLNAEGIQVYCSHEESKGITDYYNGDEFEKASSLMHSIEKNIKVNAQNIFGYSQSEALVCMERCPNNTFPIYWLPKKAPYAR